MLVWYIKNVDMGLDYYGGTHMKNKLFLVAIAVLLLMLCACGESAKNDGQSDSTSDAQKGKAPKEIIMASSLISQDEAENILGTSITTAQPDKEIPPGAIQCVYSSDDIMLQVSITQDDLLSGLNLEFGGAENIFRELVDYQKLDSPDYIFAAENIGDEAYIIDLAETNRWSIHILQDGYLIAIHLSGGEKEWVWEKLKEAGKLAVKNLK